MLRSQVVCQAFQEQRDKVLHGRLKDLLRDERRQAISFSNMFCKDAFCERSESESQASYQQKLIFLSALWYRTHLKEAIPVVILSSDPAFARTYGTCSTGISVMSLRDYLSLQFPGRKELLDLHECLAQAAQAKATAAGG